ncbi:MAG: hypothetical protein FJ404_02430 [Verrucomicrobia bacterium]|nr:hypothetical protein [Verrucomicrobiota bacterium]
MTVASLLLCVLAASITAHAVTAALGRRPNIILILADDLGYGELGSYGQVRMKTPHLDQMAREGLRFTRFYAGATVCAPSRSVLMTGQHHGRTRVRGNASPENSGAQRLTANDRTLPKMLRQAGYQTALIGKWGLGMPGDEGLPNRQGFDEFFGFLSQHHAHNHYPDYLWRNQTRQLLPNGVAPVGQQGGGYATNAIVYADDLFTEEAIQFISKPREQPYLLFLSFVVPHANNERNAALGNGTEVPSLEPYTSTSWTAPNKGHAAMVSRLDSYVGRILDHLRRTGQDKRTLVVFTSDNGPHRESGHSPEFFASAGPLRGLKRDLTEGGIRVPCLAWWPRAIPAGAVSDHTGYAGDFLATFAELAATQPSGPIDSLSLVPTLRGRPERQEKHRFLYWEFHERGFKQAALMDGRWKGIRNQGTRGPLELYDLDADPGETNNLAAVFPDKVQALVDYLSRARSESAHWPIREAGPPVPTYSRTNVLQWRDAAGGLKPVRTPEEWQHRRRDILSAMQGIMGPLPAKNRSNPPSFRVLEEIDAGTYVRRDIVFEADPGDPVPAYLLIPKAVLRGASAPGILCLHQTHAQGRKVVVGLGQSPHDQYGVELVERGYVCIAPAYPLLADYAPDLEKLGYASGTMKAVWNNLRALDLLESIPGVQRGQFASIGHSLGGHNGIFTAVFDERIKAVVSSCGLDAFRDYMKGNIKGWTSVRYMPRLAQTTAASLPFDFDEILATIAPRRVHLCAPKGDSNFFWWSVDQVAGHAQPVFDLLGSKNGLSVVHPDCGHLFPPEERERAYRIIEEVLGPGAAGR